MGAFVGACIGFLWYNAYPAQVFMGDTGSLALGGIIASLAVIVRKEWLIPIFCGVFLVENLSVLLCWFAPEPWFETIFEELENAGFNTTRMCGIWNNGFGQAKRPEIYLANSYEMFFYAWKGRPALNKAGRSNVFSYAPVPPQQKTHPKERPIEMMREIYDTFAFTGSRVLIPFLGSGSGIIAADQLGMSPIGFELSKSYRDSFLVKVHNMKVG